MASDSDIVGTKDQKVLDRDELRVIVLKRKSAELEEKADASATRLRMLRKQQEQIAEKDKGLDQQLEILKKQKQDVAEELVEVSKQASMAYEEWEKQEKRLNEQRPAIERIIQRISFPAADSAAKY